MIMQLTRASMAIIVGLVVGVTLLAVCACILAGRTDREDMPC